MTVIFECAILLNAAAGMNCRFEVKNMQTKKKFYSRFFTLYIPLVLQNVITLSVNLADNIMLGAYSEVSLSGVAAVNQIQFLYQMLLTSLGEGVVIFGSQYWGTRQIKPIKKISAMAMQAALILALCLFAVVSLFPEQVVGVFTTDGPIIRAGAEYLMVIRFTYVFFAVTQLLLAVLRSIAVVRIAFYLSVLTLFVNCGINYVLIFGRFGAPELGAVGAAVGTLAARIVEMTVLIVYIAVKEKNLKLRFRDFLQRDSVLWKDYLRVVAPMFFSNGLWGISTGLQTVILGHMTSTAIAANSAASTLCMMVKSTSTGSSSTASVMIGNVISTGDMDKIRATSRQLQKTFALIGVCSGVLLFFLRIPVLGLYDLQPETMEMANHFLMILSVTTIGMGYQMPTNCGIIRAGGDTTYVVKLDLVSIWLIVLPLSFVMVFVVKASPEVVVFCLNADQIFKCIPAYIKSNHGNWAHKLTREDTK